jgi:hypothetical protein
MEKLIYILGRKDGLSPHAFGETLLDAADALKGVGARQLMIHVADMDDKVDTPKTRTSRISGAAWQAIGGAASLWMDSIDNRGGVETILRGLSKFYDGYLVTESEVQTCPRTWNFGERRPGVTQFALGMKPQDVSDEDFYRRWQEDYGPFTFELHPYRLAYTRNAAVRALTPNAPKWRIISLERWDPLEDFTDQDRYFRNDAAARRNGEQIPGFIDLETITVGPMSEYWFD